MALGGIGGAPMRFFFDFVSRDDQEILDCEGVELADWRAAHRHAIRIVEQTVPFIPEGPDRRGWRIQVTDGNRRHLLSVLFLAASRYVAFSAPTQTRLQTNVPDLTTLFRGGEAGGRIVATPWAAPAGPTFSVDRSGYVPSPKRPRPSSGRPGRS
jgi:hypothetical protein